MYLCRTASEVQTATRGFIRLFGAAGEDRTVGLTWTDGRPIKVWRSNLREQSLAPLPTQVRVTAWELVTLRIEALNTIGSAAIEFEPF